MKKTMDNSLHHTAAAASASKKADSTKLTAKARKAALTLGAEPEEKEEKKESGLATPTSISMQTTFIITNADESFDAYYHMMKKTLLLILSRCSYGRWVFLWRFLR